MLAHREEDEAGREWGFVICGRAQYEPPARWPSGLRLLTVAQLPSLFSFPIDRPAVPTEANRLNDQILVRYYEKEWREITR